jgi:hypothetical protein
LSLQASQAIKKYVTLHEGFKKCVTVRVKARYFSIIYKIDFSFHFDSILMTCLSSQNVMQKLSQKVNVEFSKLFAITQFFKTSIKINLENCEKCPNVSSTALLRSSKESLIELREVYAMSETVNNLFIKSHSIVTKVIDAQRNQVFNAFIKSKPIDESISSIYNDILSAFDQLRKRSKEERSRKTDNTVMVKLLCDCFQLEEKLMKDIYSYIRKLIDILLQIQSHEKDLQLILKSVSTSIHKLSSLQVKVQTDLWSYIESTAKDKTVNETNFNAMNSPHTSDELVSENEKLMKSIETIISRINSVDSNDSSDDSFVHL